MSIRHDRACILLHSICDTVKNSNADASLHAGLSRFQKLPQEAATEQLEAAQQGHADAGAARSQKAADPLLGIVISQRDRFRARCAA